MKKFRLLQSSSLTDPDQVCLWQAHLGPFQDHFIFQEEIHLEHTFNILCWLGEIMSQPFS